MDRPKRILLLVAGAAISSHSFHLAIKISNSNSNKRLADTQTPRHPDTQTPRHPGASLLRAPVSSRCCPEKMPPPRNLETLKFMCDIKGRLAYLTQAQFDVYKKTGKIPMSAFSTNCTHVKVENGKIHVSYPSSEKS
jgi:hypothetical protein